MYLFQKKFFYSCATIRRFAAIKPAACSYSIFSLKTPSTYNPRFALVIKCNVCFYFCCKIEPTEFFHNQCDDTFDDDIPIPYRYVDKKIRIWHKLICQ